MVATEGPTTAVAERQVIVRDLEQLRALVKAMQEGKHVDFRASMTWRVA